MKDGKEFPINWDGTKTNIFFTSDTHFGHEAIIKFCSRPFKDAHEMDEVMINNWNNKVGPDDLIFHHHIYLILNIFILLLLFLMN